MIHSLKLSLMVIGATTCLLIVLVLVIDFYDIFSGGEDHE